MNYTYQRLNEILQAAEQKCKDGKLKAEEALLAGAAAYAIDLIDISRDAGKPLDLSFRTATNVDECIMQAHLHNMKTNHSIEESREILSKMLASYEMFKTVNDFNSLEDTKDLGELLRITVLNDSPGSKPKLIIETIPHGVEAPIRFDAFDAAKKTMKSIHLGIPAEKRAFFAGTIQPFYQRINTELIHPLVKKL